MDPLRTPAAPPTVCTAAEAKTIPKKECHVHLSGSYPLRYIKKVATDEQIDKLSGYIRQFGEGMDYRKGFGAFDLIAKIVDRSPSVMMGTYELCKWLYEDGVQHAEIRTGLKKDFVSGIGSMPDGQEGYLLSVIAGLDMAREEFPDMTIDLAVSLRKNSTVKEAEETLELAKRYRSHGITALDISGPSTDGDGLHLQDVVQQFHDHNFKVLLHLGETEAELKGTTQVTQLALFQPDRLGHCVFLTEQARQRIFDDRIPVEMCVSSAVAVGMVEKAEDHPGFDFIRAGHPVLIGTDDPLLFSVTPSEERAKVAEVLGYSKEKMEALEAGMEL